MTDNPIRVVGGQVFVDPGTGDEKTYLVGTPVYATQSVPLKVDRFGHFFFTEEQCVEKCARWSRAVSRFVGRRAKSRLELLLEADVLGISRYMPKEELLSFRHPPGIQRVVEDFYLPGMLGGARYSRSVGIVRFAVRQVVRIEKIVRRLLDVFTRGSLAESGDL